MSNEVERITITRTRLLRRGDGKTHPVRLVTQYWDDEGNLLWENDPLGSVMKVCPDLVPSKRVIPVETKKSLDSILGYETQPKWRRPDLVPHNSTMTQDAWRGFPTVIKPAVETGSQEEVRHGGRELKAPDSVSFDRNWARHFNDSLKRLLKDVSGLLLDQSDCSEERRNLMNLASYEMKTLGRFQSVLEDKLS